MNFKYLKSIYNKNNPCSIYNKSWWKSTDRYNKRKKIKKSSEYNTVDKLQFDTIDQIRVVLLSECKDPLVT